MLEVLLISVAAFKCILAETSRSDKTSTLKRLLISSPSLFHRGSTYVFSRHIVCHICIRFLSSQTDMATLYSYVRQHKGMNIEYTLIYLFGSRVICARQSKQPNLHSKLREFDDRTVSLDAKMLNTL